MGNFKFDTHMHLDLFAQREDIIKYIEEEKSYTIAMTNLPILYSKYINMYKGYFLILEITFFVFINNNTNPKNNLIKPNTITLP